MDQERPVKLSDISKALNLSVSTVSRALNDSHEIGEETKILCCQGKLQTQSYSPEFEGNEYEVHCYYCS